MSCVSSNFSPFFFNSLNDPSEFAKYLNNGENKCNIYEDMPAAVAQPNVLPNAQQQQQHYQHQQQQQQQQQQYYTHFNGGSIFHNSHSANSSNSSSNNSHTTNTSAITNNNNNAMGGVTEAECRSHHTQPPSHNGPEAMDTLPTHNYSPPVHGSNGSYAAAHTHHLQNHHLPYAAAASQALNMHHHAPAQQPLPPHPGHLTHPHPPPLLPQAAPPHAAQHPLPYAPPAANYAHHNSHAAAAYHDAPQLLQRWHNSNAVTSVAGAQNFDGSFEFLKYLRHSQEYNGSASGSTGSGSSSNTNGAQSAAAAAANVSASASAAASLLDLDKSTSSQPRSARKTAALLSSATRAFAAAAASSLDSTLDLFDHDAKHSLIFDPHSAATPAPHTHSSNSNESLDTSNFAFPNSLLNASNSNTSSESAAAGSADFCHALAGGAAGAASNAPKVLANFTLKENFEVHPSHKIEEGIFQHMNKLPSKKKENLKQLGVRFTGQMTLADKSIVVDNFIKFCQEYEITDHRPFLSLNQSGLNKPEQIKFARYLGQGLPTFTLFCIYSNFKNLFCTKRTEMYTKESYNLPYILEKTKRYLSSSTAELKSMSNAASRDGMDDGNGDGKCFSNKLLEKLVIYENFEVHDIHRIEDGICTQIARLPLKKQEVLKQYGIQSNQPVSYYEKYLIVENFIKFCNEYKITDHRPFLDFNESALPKAEQIKFARYLGQGLPNLTLNKIYLTFKDMLSLNRIEKLTVDGYNLDMVLKKKKRNLYNRIHAAAGIS